MFSLYIRFLLFVVTIKLTNNYFYNFRSEKLQNTLKCQCSYNETSNTFSAKFRRLIYAGKLFVVCFALSVPPLFSPELLVLNNILFIFLPLQNTRIRSNLISDTERRYRTIEYSGAYQRQNQIELLTLRFLIFNSFYEFHLYECRKN